jgi:hypothetical protein
MKKVIGHNKFQLQIEDLNTQLNKSTQEILSLDNNYKIINDSFIQLKNINDSLEIKYKNSIIELNSLKTQIKQLSYENTSTTFLNKEDILNLKNNIILLENNYQELVKNKLNTENEKEHFKNELLQTTNNYSNLLHKFDLQNDNILQLQNDLNFNINSNNLYKDLYLNLQKETNIIKEELTKMTKINNLLQYELSEKNKIIDNTKQQQINLEKIKQDKIHQEKLNKEKIKQKEDQEKNAQNAQNPKRSIILENRGFKNK